jgi:hypothetical protein
MSIDPETYRFRAAIKITLFVYADGFPGTEKAEYKGRGIGSFEGVLARRYNAGGSKDLP